MPSASRSSRCRAARRAGRSPLPSLDLAKLEEAALAILRQGDPTNARRSELAQELGKKGAADRYAAFLELAPSLIAREARQLDGTRARARARRLCQGARAGRDRAAPVARSRGDRVPARRHPRRGRRAALP